MIPEMVRGAPQGHFLRGSLCASKTLTLFFELPTTWFEEVDVENQPNRNSKLDGPPSPNLPPSAAGNRDLPSKPYVFSQ
jgi:hypothetical protein